MAFLRATDKDIIQSLARKFEVAFIEIGNQFIAVSKDKSLIATTTLSNSFDSNIFIGNLKSFSKTSKDTPAPKISTINPPKSEDEYCTSFNLIGSDGKSQIFDSNNFWDYEDVFVPNLDKSDAKVLVDSSNIKWLNKMIPAICPKSKERSNYRIVFKGQKKESTISYENTQHIASNNVSIGLDGNERIFQCCIKTKRFQSIMPLDYTVYFHFKETLSHWISTTTFSVEYFIPLEKDLTYE